MARLLTCGFELNDLANGSLVGHPDGVVNNAVAGGTPVISTSNARSGSRHLRCPHDGTTGASAPQWFISTTTTTIYSLRFYLSMSALPATGTGVRIFQLATIAGSDIAIAEDGSVAVTTTFATGQSVKITSGSYFRFEVQWKIDTASSANGRYEVRVNGTSLGVNSGTIGTTLPNLFQIGMLSVGGATTAINYDVDDVALNDSSGSSQTSFPGSGKIVLLKPISDNARGANWTAGAGATTNLFDAVDNTPPVGVALASATNTSQVKNVAKDTTGNYDANLTTYTTAGLVSTDTINLVHPFWNVGSSAASTISHGMLLVSNPAANGGVESTFTPTAIAGSYGGTSWVWQVPAAQIVYAPSPTLGTSPVLRIGKRTSNTAAAMSDAMGAYVDYTPAAPKSLIFPPRTARNSLLRR